MNVEHDMISAGILVLIIYLCPFAPVLVTTFTFFGWGFRSECLYKRWRVVVTMAEDKVQKLWMSDRVLPNSLAAVMIDFADVHPTVLVEHPDSHVILGDVSVQMNVRYFCVRDKGASEVSV